MRAIAVVVATVLLSAAPSAAKKPRRRPPKPANAKVTRPAAPSAPALVAIETIERPKRDYLADVYSGVPLDDRYAKDRGFDKGLVLLVFEKRRALAFRVPHEKVKKWIRFVPTSAAIRGHVDWIDSDDGVVLVDTTTTAAGIFTTSDVYVFPSSSTPDSRRALLGKAAPAAARERVTSALALARDR